MYFSPYIILLGQFLSGTIGARNAIIEAELSRIFSKDEISHKTAITVLFTTFGSLSGPCLIFTFEYVHIGFGDWQLMIRNMPGFYMCFLSTIELFLDYFILKNVSKEFYEKLSEERLKTGLGKHLANVTSIKEYMGRMKYIVKQIPIYTDCLKNKLIKNKS